MGKLLSTLDGRLLRPLALAMIVLAAPPALATQGDDSIMIAYLAQIVERPPKLSNLDLPPDDDGIQGDWLAIRDNNSTGSFLNQSFELIEVVVAAEGDAAAAFETLVAQDIRFVILNVPAKELVKIADLPSAQNVLICPEFWDSISVQSTASGDTDWIAKRLRSPGFLSRTLKLAGSSANTGLARMASTERPTMFR